MTDLPNPYDDDTLRKQSDVQVKTTVQLSNADMNYLRGIYTRKGLSQALIATLVKQLVTTLKNHGFKQYDPDRFTAAVSNLTVTLPIGECGFSDGAIAIPIIPVGNDANPKQASHGDDGRGTHSMAHVANRPMPLPAEAGSAPTRVRREVKGKRAKG